MSCDWLQICGEGSSLFTLLAHCRSATARVKHTGSLFLSQKKKGFMENEFVIHFKKENELWAANLRSEVDEQKKIAGFGKSPEEAFKDLMLEQDKDEYQKQVRDQKTQ
jgi:hypothetical protein